MFNQEFLDYPAILFGPVVERNPKGFLLDEPEELYKKGLVASIPWITGVTKNEGELLGLGIIAFKIRSYCNI